MIDARLLLAWIGLQVGGAVLGLIVRRKDRGRAEGERRSGSLWAKYGSYFVITGVVLFLGGRSWSVVSWAVCLAGLVAAYELFDAVGEDEFAIKVVFRFGIGVIAFGVLALLIVKSFDPSGGAWGWLWLVVATTDAYSQLFGQGWGTAKMAPQLSPGKTWFGFAAGTASAVCVGVLLRHVLFQTSVAKAVVVALGTSLAATAGDLVESWMKRRLGIKDFSNTLGVHGGVLDRFDSLLGAAPVFAVLYWYI